MLTRLGYSTLCCFAIFTSGACVVYEDDGGSGSGGAAASSTSDATVGTSGAGGMPSPAATAGTTTAGVTTSSSAATSGSGGGASGPCGGSVPVTGICTSPTEVSTCVVPSEKGLPFVQKQTCAVYEQCVVLKGVAQCAPKPGKCQPGSTQCLGSNTEQFCNASGDWQQQACTGCQDSGFGAVCTGGMATKVYSGYVKYEARGVNASFTDWGTTKVVVPAQGALVVSYAWDQSTQSYKAMDSAVTDASGFYVISIPAIPSAKDVLNIFAIRLTADKSGFAFAVANPDLPPSQWDVQKPVPPGAVRTQTGGAGDGTTKRSERRAPRSRSRNNRAAVRCACSTTCATHTRSPSSCTSPLGSASSFG